MRRFPEEEDFSYGASFGLMTIQLHYNLSYAEVVAGIVTDPTTGEKLEAVGVLDEEDALAVSRVARKVWRLDKEVEWCTVALELAGSQDKERQE